MGSGEDTRTLIWPAVRADAKEAARLNSPPLVRGKETAMTTHEMFERNQQLSTEFDLYLLDHPEVADQIPDGALVVFVPAFDKELARRNRALARKSRAPGQPVVYVQVARMGASRVGRPDVESGVSAARRGSAGCDPLCVAQRGAPQTNPDPVRRIHAHLYPQARSLARCSNGRSERKCSPRSS